MIVVAGAIPPLVALVCNGSDGKEEAACALASLACKSDIAAQWIVDAGGIAALVELLRKYPDAPIFAFKDDPCLHTVSD